MNRPLEHLVAYYKDKHGILRPIAAEKLINKEDYAFAESQKLTDNTGQLTLVPRTPKRKRPHFMHVGTPPQRNVYEGEDDEVHNTRVENLWSSLSALRSWNLALADPKDEKGKKRFWQFKESVDRMPQYTWGCEIHRIVSSDAVVRHDVFGQAGDIAMSVQRPWVAIEVIHTHFPEEAAFSGMLAMSLRVPFYVLFDFTHEEDKFVRVESDCQALIYRDWTYLIHDGKLWRGSKATGITTAEDFRKAASSVLNDWYR